jgi:hypothetical protein
MSYYKELIRNIDRSMKAHPHSTVVMDADSFKVIATGKQAKTLTRKLMRTKARGGVPVIFQRPDDGCAWILATRSKL